MTVGNPFHYSIGTIFINHYNYGMNPFVSGLLAGYGIAVPVGAIAVLIIEAGLRRGFPAGFAAGAGAATADLIYALAAALTGQALALALQPFATQLRLVSALVLVGLGSWGLYRTVRAGRNNPLTTQPLAQPESASLLRIYIQFVGLTLLNPLTIAYFSALILGSSAALPGWSVRGLFVAGAGLASLSWQSLLAGVGALGHRHFSPGMRLATSLAGNLIVIGLGIRMLL